MFQAKVNNKNFQISPEENGFLVNNEMFTWDTTPISAGYFHIIYKNKSYRAEVVKTDADNKSVWIKINGKTYVVELKDKIDLLLEKMGIQSGASVKINSIKAPMPGLIISLKVNEGDVVKKNDPILILEAMKMENIIKSPGDGVVRAVKIKQGQSVEKNQILIEFA